MPIEYGILAPAFIAFDGSNKQEILQALLPFWDPSQYPLTVNVDTPTNLSLTMDWGFRTWDMDLLVGSRLAIATLEVVTAADWAIRYAKP
jgi:hypothetical protein